MQKYLIVILSEVKVFVRYKRISDIYMPPYNVYYLKVICVQMYFRETNAALRYKSILLWQIMS